MRAELLARFPRLELLPPGTFVVGGAIRDLLLGVEPDDVDLVASDGHRAAQAIGGRLIELGSGDQRVSRVIAGRGMYDFTSYGAEGLEGDLRRRDFTINAIAFDWSAGIVVDPLRGRADIDCRVLRTPQLANFEDDPVRVLRAVRFALRLGFDIDPPTSEAARRQAASIQSAAAERVTDELLRILNARDLILAIALLRGLQLFDPLELKHLSPAVGDVGAVASLAVMVADPASYAERWRWSRSLLRDVLTVQRLLAGDDLLALFKAGSANRQSWREASRLLGRAADIDEERFNVEQWIDGERLIGLTGMAPGPQVGAILDQLLLAQLQGRVRSREEAEDFVRMRKS